MPATNGGPGTYIQFGPWDHKGYKGDFLTIRELRDGDRLAGARRDAIAVERDGAVGREAGISDAGHDERAQHRSCRDPPRC